MRLATPSFGRRAGRSKKRPNTQKLLIIKCEPPLVPGGTSGGSHRRVSGDVDCVPSTYDDTDAVTAVELEVRHVQHLGVHADVPEVACHSGHGIPKLDVVQAPYRFAEPARYAEIPYQAGRTTPRHPLVGLDDRFAEVCIETDGLKNFSFCRVYTGHC